MLSKMAQKMSSAFRFGFTSLTPDYLMFADNTFIMPQIQDDQFDCLEIDHPSNQLQLRNLEEETEGCIPYVETQEMKFTRIMRYFRENDPTQIVNCKTECSIDNALELYALAS